MSMTTKIEINPLFQKALHLMENTKRNIFITGRAGTGKSTLLDYFRSVTKKQIVVLAPTGVAARKWSAVRLMPDAFASCASAVGPPAPIRWGTALPPPALATMIAHPGRHASRRPEPAATAQRGRPAPSSAQRRRATAPWGW